MAVARLGASVVLGILAVGPAAHAFLQPARTEGLASRISSALGATTTTHSTRERSFKRGECRIDPREAPWRLAARSYDGSMA
jgi:hypothetical protein